MDQLKRVDELQRMQALRSDRAQPAQREVARVVRLAVELGRLCGREERRGARRGLAAARGLPAFACRTRLEFASGRGQCAASVKWARRFMASAAARRARYAGRCTWLVTRCTWLVTHLVKVIAQQLAHDEEMLSVVEVIEEP